MEDNTQKNIVADVNATDSYMFDENMSDDFPDVPDEGVNIARK